MPLNNGMNDNRNKNEAQDIAILRLVQQGMSGRVRGIRRARNRVPKSVYP